MTGFEAAQDHVFEEFEIEPRQRFVDLDRRQVRIHVTEVGDERSDEVPVFFVHGVGFFGSMFAPLMAHLDDTWMISIDRPGYGLSGDFTYTDFQNVRQTIVDILEGVLDELGMEQVDLVGNSVGGHWSIVFALARPERVRRQTLIGAPAGFPGTNPPFLFRLFSVPVLNRLLVRLQDPSEDGVVEQFKAFGEGETIQEYPSLIRAIIAQDRNPRSDDVVLNELQARQTILGYRSSIRLSENEVVEMQQPTLIIWGENEPLAGPEEVRDTVERMSKSHFETLEAGHFPWLGHPEICAERILDMRK